MQAVQEQGVERVAEGWQAGELWRAIDAMQIEPPGAALSFPARLARENGWSRSYAEMVVQEYKRFLYLAAQSPEPVTPSDEVDQAWHLHLAYSRHYWDVLCGEILKRPLHHGPTAGGETEGVRYRRQYEETLALYRRVFGRDAPAAVWPDAERRFSTHAVRVDRSRYWMIPRAAPARAATAGAVALLGACSLLAAAREKSDAGLEFEDLMNAIFVTALVIAAVIGLLNEAKRRGEKDRGSGSCGSGGCGAGGGDSGCGGGGCGGCGG